VNEPGKFCEMGIDDGDDGDDDGTVKRDGIIN
jgi:hypothetical protein